MVSKLLTSGSATLSATYYYYYFHVQVKTNFRKLKVLELA